jgi:hypothetical protein
MALVYGRAHEKLSRRRFLRGSGVAIALPLLQGAAGVTFAQSAQIPERLIGLFVAMGLPAEITKSFLDHDELGVKPFRSLKPLETKICMVRGLDVRTQGRAQNEHTKGCASFLCGSDYSQSSFSSKGGVTLDWMVKEELKHDTLLPTLNTGVWGGDNKDEAGRIIHSWRDVNKPNDPIADPQKVFDYIFGSAGSSMTGNASQNKDQHYRKSVLDAVVNEYKSVTGANSGFSSDVKNLISNHLETVRELEKRISGASVDGAAAAPQACSGPTRPASEKRNGEYRAAESFVRDEWPKLWDILTDLAVIAYRCDLVRTGTMMVDSGGNDFGFKGALHGSTGNHHEMLHQWRSNRGLSMEVWQWLYDLAAKFLVKLDSRDYVDVNGKTLLENSTIVMGTELGDPVHNLNDMTFMIAGGRGRFKPGMHTFTDRTDVDLYNTLLTSVGITQKRIGTLKNYTGDLHSILV